MDCIFQRFRAASFRLLPPSCCCFRALLLRFRFQSLRAARLRCASAFKFAYNQRATIQRYKKNQYVNICIYEKRKIHIIIHNLRILVFPKRKAGSSMDGPRQMCQNKAQGPILKSSKLGSRCRLIPSDLNLQPIETQANTRP